MAWKHPNTVFSVVVNHEEQYSIWPSQLRMPAGWKATGKEGKKAECIRHIEEVWTDMRPLIFKELLNKMEAKAERATS